MHDNPAWNGMHRQRVRQAIDRIMVAARDIDLRYFDEGSSYSAPPEIEELGDVTGFIAAARHQVIRRLEEELTRAREVMLDVSGEVDARKRERYGESYTPPRRSL